jgi:hypothetical protein
MPASKRGVRSYFPNRVIDLTEKSNICPLNFPSDTNSQLREGIFQNPGTMNFEASYKIGCQEIRRALRKGLPPNIDVSGLESALNEIIALHYAEIADAALMRLRIRDRLRSFIRSELPERMTCTCRCDECKRNLNYADCTNQACKERGCADRGCEHAVEYRSQFHVEVHHDGWQTDWSGLKDVLTDDDYKILTIMQSNGELSHTEIGRKLGLASRP